MSLSRDVDPALLETVQGVFYPVILAFLDWPDAPVYAHSNVGAIEWNGEEWQGVGSFGAIVLPEEATGLGSVPAEFRLVGAPEGIDGYIDDEIRGRETKVYFGAVTERSGNILIGEPVEIFSGTMDALRDTLTTSGDEQVRDVILRASIGPSQREFAAAFHTAEDQARAYPGDTAGRLVINSEAEAKKLKW